LQFVVEVLQESLELPVWFLVGGSYVQADALFGEAVLVGEVAVLALVLWLEADVAEDVVEADKWAEVGEDDDVASVVGVVSIYRFSRCFLSWILSQTCTGLIKHCKGSYQAL